MEEKENDAFWTEREAANTLVLKHAGLVTKRFFNLDTQAYTAGALPTRTKELLGLVSSFVLRCDDCISYHVRRCAAEGVSTAEFEEALAVGLVVSGSVTIPHLRRAFRLWEQLSATAGRPPGE